MESIERIEKRNREIIENAIEWSNDRECDPLYPIDILIIGDYLDVKIPKCFNRFIESKSRNRIRCTGAEKTIFKTLDRIAEKLKEDTNI